MIVLGWTSSDAIADADMATLPCGSIALLTVPQGQASTPRARLEWQTQHLKTGADLLPVAPDQTLTVADARELDPLQLSAAFARIAGTVQFTLSMRLQKSADTDDRQKTGRNWLETKRATKVSQDRACTALEGVARTARPAGTSIRQTPHTAHCDILLHRQTIATVRQSMFEAAQSSDLPEEAELILSGPWPPYSFAQLNEAARAC